MYIYAHIINVKKKKKLLLLFFVCWFGVYFSEIIYIDSVSSYLYSELFKFIKSNERVKLLVHSFKLSVPILIETEIYLACDFQLNVDKETLIKINSRLK